MASPPIVIYDSCVLYSAVLRDVFMQMALTGLFHARWTQEIHNEWMTNLLEKRPDIQRSQLERIKTLMNRYVEHCIVTDYELLIPKLKLPDPGDRHVLAAAIQTKANIILTFNLKDFPSASLSNYSIEALHPDQFLLNLIQSNPAETMAALEKCRQRLKNPPKSWPEYLDMLKRQGLLESVTLLGTLQSH